jgi:glycosyltransferase involved in cell wall biosynthesis
MTALFVFKGNRRARLDAGGDIPREFFYGCTELGGRFIEESDRPPPLPEWLERAGTAVLAPLSGLNLATLARLAARRGELDAAGIVVTTTNSQTLALGALKAMGLVKARVVGVVMGLPARPWFLRGVDLAPISLAEAEALGLPRSAYLPFGVDTRFWSPGGRPGDYVLAVGNDPNRDWATLAAAWHPGLPPLKIVTRRTVPPSAGRVEVIAGDWHGRGLTDAELRDLYRGARAVVVPSRDTIQPAGQSVSLQAMACGRPVVLSDIRGLWDRPALAGCCTLVPPGDAAALAAAVDAAPADGSVGRATVERLWTIEIMAAALAARLGETG